MTESDTHMIQVGVETSYIDDQSDPGADRYVFAYTITISNTGKEAAKLLNRHWLITDANGKIQEVRGEGVVGEQPYLRPGEMFRYTSGTVLETPVGTMEGNTKCWPTTESRSWRLSTAFRWRYRASCTNPDSDVAVFAVGDIRSCYDELRRALDSVGFDPRTTGCGVSVTWSIAAQSHCRCCASSINWAMPQSVSSAITTCICWRWSPATTSTRTRAAWMQ